MPGLPHRWIASYSVPGDDAPTYLGEDDVSTQPGAEGAACRRQLSADSVEKVGVGRGHPSIAPKPADYCVAT